MEAIQFLPKSFSDFAQKLGFKKEKIKDKIRAEEYAEILIKESSGEWVIDMAIKLSESISKDEAKKEILEIERMALPDFNKEIYSSPELGHLYNKIWFFRQEYRSKNQPTKASRKALSLEFRNLKIIRESGGSASDSITRINIALLIMQNLVISKMKEQVHEKRRAADKSRNVLIRGFFPYNFVDLYNRATKNINIKEKPENPYKGLKRIGFGVDSNFKPHPVRRESVNFDKNTLNDKQSPKHILYAAGWSLREDRDD